MQAKISGDVLEHTDADAQRVRILETFERLARDVGPRHVGMARLATELGISTKTLYQNFSNKADLVTALIQFRVSGWRAQRETQIAARMPTVMRGYRLAHSWVNYLASFSPDFWHQIRRDFPETQQIIDAEYEAFLRLGYDPTERIIRQDTDPRAALFALRDLIEKAANRRYCEMVGLPPAEVLRQQYQIWVRGAVRPEEIIELDQLS